MKCIQLPLNVFVEVRFTTKRDRVVQAYLVEDQPVILYTPILRQEHRIIIDNQHPQYLSPTSSRFRATESKVGAVPLDQERFGA